jgi:AraC family transcriptional regulator
VNSSNKINNQNKPQWVSLLQEILNDRWNEQLTLNELCTLTQVHPVTISKNFTKYFTCTLGEYMRKLKIDRSIRLIKNQNLSLTDIAFECGFADQSHFIRTFKELTGWLPKKFQQL